LNKIRVLLVDDHAVLRSGLQMAVDSQADMEVAGHAARGHDAIAQAEACHPDVVVMDLSLPDLDGALVTEAIRRQHPKMRVLAFTRHADQGYLRRMLQAGASGYVLKHAEASAVLSAIRVVAGGGAYIDPVLAGSMVESVIGRMTSLRKEAAHNDLTPRERDVLRLIAWGRSNKEIAARYKISIKTVEYYKAHAVDKLQLRSRTDIVRYALSQGWLHADQEPE
jgi:DNA-binding NarL/FixJ family response regulator